MDGKCAADAGTAFHRHTPAMGLHDVLDNGEAQSRSTELATACPVDTIKPFEESRQVGRLNSATLITHAHPHFVHAYASMLCMGRR